MVYTRLFSAIAIPKEFYPEVANLRGGFDSKFLGLTPLENLHITLKFYGEVDLDRLLEIRTQLKAVQEKSFQIKADGIGLFGKFPRHVVYIKIRDNKSLGELHNSIYAAHNIASPDTYMPHITICRTKLGLKREELEKFLEYNRNFSLPSFEVKSFGLFSSAVTHGGHREYKQVEEFLLD